MPSQVMFMVKCSPTALNFGYDFVLLVHFCMLAMFSNLTPCSTIQDCKPWGKELQKMNRQDKYLTSDTESGLKFYPFSFVYIYHGDDVMQRGCSRENLIFLSVGTSLKLGFCGKPNWAQRLNGNISHNFQCILSGNSNFPTFHRHLGILGSG